MASSYRVVNYSLRPAKAVERKMLCDLFRRLEPFGRVENYRYIGFGSIYFSDFHLFHQVMGISDMISVEKDERNFARFDFNKPFRCVDLKPGHSNKVLPVLDWSKRVIVWLDYDGKLDKEVLADIATFCSKAVSGSLLLVSVNVEPEFGKPGATPDEQNATRLKSLADAIGEEKIPLGVTGADLRAEGFASVCYRVIDNEIKTLLGARSGPLSHESKSVYRQLINLKYADDAQMMTIGGLIFENQHQPLVEECAFGDLSFVRGEADTVNVRAPKFTQKEIRALNAKLPEAGAEKTALPGVPEIDVIEFAKIYRYYPSFGEVLLG